MRRLAAVVLSAGFAAGPVLAAGAPPDKAATDVAGRNLAATCSQCHGSAGRMPAGAAVPGLAGVPAAYLVDRMQAFRGGSRPATVMHQIAKGYSDAQIARLAAYFAAQPAEMP